MLTKTDLNKIREIVREEVEAEAKNTQEELQGEIKLARIEIQKELGTLKERLKNQEVENIKSHLNLPSPL